MTEPSRLRDWLNYSLRGPGAWLIAELLLVMGLVILTKWLSDYAPWWTLLLPIPLLLVTTPVMHARGSGYRIATPEEAEQIRARGLWHVTASPDVYDQVAGTADLSPAHCRWLSRMTHRGRPFGRRVPAVYAFSNRPRLGQLEVHVRRRQRLQILHLEGSAIRYPVYVGPLGAVALPQGFSGPACVDVQHQERITLRRR